MPSRMDRYYTTKTGQRTKKNENLYRTLYNNEEYTNIASVATLGKTNEIDITKIKQLLKDRENYKKEKEYREVTHKVEPREVQTISNPTIEEEKNYDIRDILSKAKEERKADPRYDSIKNIQYDYLLNSKAYQKQIDKGYVATEEDEKLREIINTITNNSQLNKLKDEELSLDLLNDLKSNNSTIIESSSIRNIIDSEIKNNIEPKEEIEMDKSFYTSSLGFKEEDFEDLKEIKSSIKKNNKMVKTTLIIILLVITVVALYFTYQLIQKA